MSLALNNRAQIFYGPLSKHYHSLHLDRWMDDLRFLRPIQPISVISGQWQVDNERLCAMEPLYG